MVEHCCLGGARSAAVVVDGDGVHDLGQHASLEPSGVRLDRADPELNVSEQTSFLRRPERRSRAQLECPARVVEQRGRDEEVAAEPLMHLRGLAAQSRHRDGVLEKASRIDMVRLWARGQLPEPRAVPIVRE